MKREASFQTLGARLQAFYGALHQLLRIVQMLEHERDVHSRPAGKPVALAVDAVLPHQRERIGEQIEGDGEPPAGASHHRLVVLEGVAVLVENRLHGHRSNLVI